MAVRLGNNKWSDDPEIEEALYGKDLNDTFENIDMSKEVFYLMSLNKAGIYNYDNLLVDETSATINQSRIDLVPQLPLTEIDPDVSEILSYGIIPNTDKIRLYFRNSNDKCKLIDIDMSDMSHEILLEDIDYVQDIDVVNYPATMNAKFCSLHENTYRVFTIVRRSDGNAYRIIVNTYNRDTHDFVDTVTSSDLISSSSGVANASLSNILEIKENSIIFAAAAQRYAATTETPRLFIREISETSITSIRTESYSADSTFRSFTDRGWLKDGTAIWSWGWMRYGTTTQPFSYGIFLSDGTNPFFETRGTSTNPSVQRMKHNHLFGVRFGSSNNGIVYHLREDGTLWSTPKSSPWENQSYITTRTDKTLVARGTSNATVICYPTSTISNSNWGSDIREEWDDTALLSPHATCESQTSFHINNLTIYNVENLRVDSTEIELAVPVTLNQFTIVDTIGSSTRGVYNLAGYIPQITAIFTDDTEVVVDSNTWYYLGEEKTLSKIKVSLRGIGGGTATLGRHIIPYRK